MTEPQPHRRAEMPPVPADTSRTPPPAIPPAAPPAPPPTPRKAAGRAAHKQKEN